MYKSSLRHIHDPVLSSLKMNGILFFNLIAISDLIFLLSPITSISAYSRVCILNKKYISGSLLPRTSMVPITKN
jgi:hypothetical protein